MRNQTKARGSVRLQPFNLHSYALPKDVTSSVQIIHKQPLDNDWSS